MNFNEIPGQVNCSEIRESMLEVASGTKPSPAMADHLLACSVCATELAEFRQTMAMLDEWQVPEPSPYFDTRLMARVREQQTLAATRKGWLGWMWKPVLGAAMATAMLAGVAVYRQSTTPPPQQAAIKPVVSVPADRGTAVADLQALDESRQSYSDFEVLDELQPDGTQASANQTN